MHLTSVDRTLKELPIGWTFISHHCDRQLRATARRRSLVSSPRAHEVLYYSCKQDICCCGCSSIHLFSPEVDSESLQDAGLHSQDDEGQQAMAMPSWSFLVQCLPNVETLEVETKIMRETGSELMAKSEPGPTASVWGSECFTLLGAESGRLGNQSLIPLTACKEDELP